MKATFEINAIWNASFKSFMIFGSTYNYFLAKLCSSKIVSNWILIFFSISGMFHILQKISLQTNRPRIVRVIFSEPELTLLSHGLCQINQLRYFPWHKISKKKKLFQIFYYHKILGKIIDSSERGIHNQWFAKDFKIIKQFEIVFLKFYVRGRS